jgi:hypothetical protein
MNDNNNENTLAETDSFEIWVDHDEEGEPIFHVHLGVITVHLSQDEWEEMVTLFNQIED